MDLIGQWAKWRSDQPPFVLEADQAVLSLPKSKRAVVTFNSWSEAYGADDFCKPGDSRLHLGLLPGPFYGDLLKASIYILLLNPGLGPHDYFGEYKVPEYRNALLSNLKQQFQKDSIPFLFLNPQYSWHGGFGWWHNKLSQVIEQLSAMWSVTFATARTMLGQKLAVIELLPYHSVGFRDANSWLRKLPSVELA